jgi:hypothetical protein
MFAAESSDAIIAGDYQLVLGEFHASVVTLQTCGMLQLSPLRQEVLNAMSADLASLTGRLLGTEETKGTARVQTAWLGGQRVEQIAPLQPVYTSVEATSLLSDFVVERLDGEMVLSHRSGDRSHRLLDVLGPLIVQDFLRSFSVLPVGTHRPRVEVDKLVVCREAWGFSTEDLPFANLKPERCYLECRRWARSVGLPRFAFYAVPHTVELKPQYLDLDSLVSVAIFAKTIRRTANDAELADDDKRVVVTEMLPTSNDLWLQDHEGERYTSELRLVMVDLGRSRRDVSP